MTISQLAAAGVREAADLADMFGFGEFMEQYNVTGSSVAPMAVVQEARFSFINRYIENSSFTNIMDLACGFSPRGLLMARKGLRYLGIDLEAASTAMSGLEYISSAGLRTLLIMQKGLKDSKLRLTGAQEIVMDILKQTGFSELFDIA